MIMFVMLPDATEQMMALFLKFVNPNYVLLSHTMYYRFF
jgi:hypothetical protein